MAPDPFDPPLPEPRARITSPWVFVGGSLAVGIGLPLAGLVWVTNPPPADQVGLGLILGGPVAAILFGLAAVVPAVRIRSVSAVTGGLAGLAAAAAFGFAVPVVFLAFARGRQLRQGGRLELPPVGPGGDWALPADGVALPPELRTAVATAWRENGRTEHASVAAFARLSLELVALGAPPDLLVDAARDAVDEIRHTEATFALARAIDGQALSPAPFPAASTAGALQGSPVRRLCELGVTSLVDGVLHEGVSARVIGALVDRTELPAVARVLAVLAADEDRHARHAWDVVTFCLRAGGEPVRRALAEAAAAIPAEIRAPHADPRAASGDWERYGIAGHPLEQQQYTGALQELRSRLGELVRAHAA